MCEKRNRGNDETRMTAEAVILVSSFEIGVVMGVRRRAAAEKAQRLPRADRMPCAGRDEDGISGADGAGFAIDFHFPGAFEDEIEFFAEFVIVALRRASERHPRFGEALLFDGRVGAIEDAPDGGPVFRGEWRLGFEVQNNHGERS